MNTFLTAAFDNQVFSVPELVAFVPNHVWRYMIGYAVFLGLCAIALVLSYVLAKRVAPALLQRFRPLFINNLIFGAVIFFFRYQEIPLFGMDLWRFIQYIVSIFWVVYSVRTYRKEHVITSFTEAVAARKNKYLPKPKSA